MYNGSMRSRNGHEVPLSQEKRPIIWTFFLERFQLEVVREVGCNESFTSAEFMMSQSPSEVPYVPADHRH